MSQLHYVMAEIKRRFIKSRVTQRSLARATGTTQSHISEIFNENVETDKNPTLLLVTRLAGAHDLHIALVDDNGNVVAAPRDVLARRKVAMKIKRTALIEILTRKLSDSREKANTRYLARLEEYAESERRYDDETLDAWREFSRVISQRVEVGEFVQPSDIPRPIRSELGGLRFFTEKEPNAPTSTRSEHQFERLIEILQNSTDDEVSTHALEKMGFPIGRVLNGEIN